MKLALLHCGGNGPGGSSFTSILRGAVDSPSSLLQLLSLILLSSLGQLALLCEWEVSEEGGEREGRGGAGRDDLLTRGASLLSSTLRLPGIDGLRGEAKALLPSLLLSPVRVGEWWGGEFTSHSPSELSRLVEMLGEGAARMALSHRLLLAVTPYVLGGGEGGGTSPQLWGEVERLAHAICECLPSLLPTNSPSPKWEALRTFLAMGGDGCEDIATSKLLSLLRSPSPSSLPLPSPSFLRRVEDELGPEASLLRSAFLSEWEGDQRPIAMVGARELIASCRELGRWGRRGRGGELTQGEAAEAAREAMAEEGEGEEGEVSGVACGLRCLLRLYQMASTSPRARGSEANSPFLLDVTNVTRLVRATSPYQLAQASALPRTPQESKMRPPSQ